MQINLTSRTKSLPQKVLGTFIKEFDSQTNNLVYKARYSSEYKDEGHDYTKSFKVLRLAYLLKYKILTNLDISVYEWLQLLCGEEIPFSLAVLADQLGIGDATLRKCLDNLENAELLEIVKSDGQGKPNWYIIRTPYFLREDFKETQKARVLRKYKELPETFLEEVAEILKRNVRKNKAKKIRNLQRNKFLGNRKQVVKKIIDDLKETRRRTWFKIVKYLGNQNAINFDSIVWRLCHDKDLIRMFGKDFEAAFKRKLKFELEKVRIDWNSDYFDFAQELRAFYDSRLNIRPVEKQTSSIRAASPSNDNFEDVRQSKTDTENEDKANEIILIKKVLEERKAKGTLPKTSADLKSFFTNIGLGNLTFNDLLTIVKDFFAPDVWQKLKVELLL